jgi:hypothetical protein
MRNRGNILMVPGASTREQKVSAFKTISFLESTPENEPGAGFLDHLRGDEGDPAQVPPPNGDRHYMGRLEGETGVQAHQKFLHDKDTFSRVTGTEDITFMTLSHISAEEKTVPVISPQGNRCGEIPQKNGDTVEYPGRSVLYSRHFHPMNRIISTHSQQPPLGEP